MRRRRRARMEGSGINQGQARADALMLGERGSLREDVYVLGHGEGDGENLTQRSHSSLRVLEMYTVRVAIIVRTLQFVSSRTRSNVTGVAIAFIAFLSTHCDRPIPTSQSRHPCVRGQYSPPWIPIPN